MQQPPPGPPEGPMEPPPPPVTPPAQPPPYDMGTGRAAVSNSKLYTILAWVLFPPIGSIVMLFVAKDDPDAKFNAANATVVHGAFFVVWLVLYILTRAIFLFGVLLFIWDVIWFVVWLVGLVLALQSEGRRFSFPVLSDMLSGFIPTVEGMAQ